MVVPRLRTVPPLAARCSAPADFASLRVLGAPAASRPPLLTSSLAALPASLGLLRPVSRTARGLRAPLTPSPLRGFDGFGLFRALRAAFVRPAYGGPVFRRFAPPSPSAARCSGAADAFWACPRASSRFAASNGQRPGRECIFTHSSQSSIHIARKACLWLSLLTGLTSACFRHRRRPPCASSIRNGRPAAPDGLQYSLAHWAYFGLFRALRAAFVRPAKNARNDVHAVISDLNLVLSILCQGSERGSSLKQMPAFFALRWDCERTTIVFRRPAFVKGGYKAK